MDTITIPKKEYEKLKEAKRRLESAGYWTPKDKTRKIFEGAFGVLRGGFGKRSSVFYVSKLRKAWRK